jgi:excisionase family DNA binding protein
MIKIISQPLFRPRNRRSCVMADRAKRPPVPPLLYRVEEAAEALRLSRTAIYELIRSGRLRTVKAGSGRLVPVAALAEYVASLERAA